MAGNKVDEYFQLWVDYCLKLKQSGHDLADAGKIDENKDTRKRPFEETSDTDNGSESPKKRIVEEQKEIQVAKKTVNSQLSLTRLTQLVNSDSDNLIKTNEAMNSVSNQILLAEIKVKDETIKKQGLMIREMTLKLAMLNQEVTTLRNWVNFVINETVITQPVQCRLTLELEDWSQTLSMKRLFKF